MPADEHTVWPHGVGGHLRVPCGVTSTPHAANVAAYLTGADVAPRDQLAAHDANLRTHDRVRRVAAGHNGRPIVHHLNGYFVDETHVPPRTVGFITSCGHILPLTDAVRCGLEISCATRECAFMAQKHERPATVVRPSGACHGGAAKTTTGVTLPDNGVAIRPDRDSFQSVKNAAVNRVNGQPRSQVATAGATARTTSSARAGRPSKGESRVMESVAPDG